jgi:hypothetical protein
MASAGAGRRTGFPPRLEAPPHLDVGQTANPIHRRFLWFLELPVLFRGRPFLFIFFIFTFIFFVFLFFPFLFQFYKISK